MAWGDPDREDSDALEFSLFRSLSPNRVQEVSENFVEAVVFADEDLRPAPEAYGAISFGCGLYDAPTTPFFPDIHQEVSRSWKQPFSARITNAVAADFATITDMAGRGYATMPPVEETLAEHLVPNSATAWKSRPLLPSKPCRVTSSLVGKSYSAAGQAAATLHSMAVLQAYQVELLKELDEGEGITPAAVKELQRATDLALRATKHTARERANSRC